MKDIVQRMDWQYGLEQEKELTQPRAPRVHLGPPSEKPENVIAGSRPDRRRIWLDEQRDPVGGIG